MNQSGKAAPPAVQSILPNPCNKKQLAEEMGISISTLQRSLKKANIIIGRGIIPPKQKKQILDELGWSETI